MIEKEKRWWALYVLCAGELMIVLDTTVVNVALPSIRESLGFSEASLVWVVNAYMLTYGGFLLLGGRMADLFGRRRLFILGTVGFTIASLLSGLAHNTEMLIGARFFQGLMAAIMVPQILSIIQILYTTTKERQGISAFYGALAGIATVLGPILGALLITGDVFGLGWRTIFLVNLPT